MRALIVALSIGYGYGQFRVPIATRGMERTNHGWSSLEAPCKGRIHFTVFLKQRNLDVLDATFKAVSDPDSPRYGQFLTKQEVDQLVGASRIAISAVSSWLISNGVDEGSFELHADSVTVDTDCASASRVFAASFRQYEHKDHGQPHMLLHGVATVPVEVAEHVDFVMGISELWRGRSQMGNSRRAHHNQVRDAVDLKVQDALDLKVTPQLLRTYYNVPEDETNASPEKNLQAVIAFDDYYSEGALQQFYQQMSTTAPTMQVVGVDCLNDPQKPCDQVESDLDVQYMTAMAGMGSVKTMFHNTNTSDGWVLMKTERLLKLPIVPYVMSISYGWAELKECDLAFLVCDKLGYDAKKYVQRTNVNFQKLALMGASIFVSDGDDGAQGVQPSGWDPLDPDHWCPAKWDCYPATHSKCGEMLLHNITSGQKCVYPVGHMSDACNFLFLGDFYQESDIQKALKSANPSCNMNFYIDSSLNTHMFSECTCSELQPLHHEDIISEAFNIQTFTDLSHRFFYADFPTSSPYVTSVGATLFKSSDGKTVNAEHVASIKDGAIITTGGGFSTMAEQPDFQKVAIQGYVDGSTPKPPASQYDATQRGYPDISLNGHNYQVYTADNKKTDCPCSVHSVDGTSASSPSLAGMISLINGHLLAAGRGPLGFINPLLYKAHADDAAIFNDITTGDTSCTRDYCMKYGYTAGNGWDPTSGLGSVNYAKLKAYALKQASTVQMLV